MPHYLRCYECKKKVDMYEERVYTWSRADHQNPRGFTDDMLCEPCHKRRINADTTKLRTRGREHDSDG